MSAALPLRRLVPSWLRRFTRDEDGVISVQNLFLVLAACAIGAAGVDGTYFFAARTELQVAADVAAHAALYRRNQGTTTVDQARTDGIARAQYGMPSSMYGNVIEAADVTFGSFNEATQTFMVNPNSRSAAWVVTGRDRAGENPVASFFYRIVGIDAMNVRTQAIVMRSPPGCLTNGFAAKQEVKITSDNQFFDDFCLHSNIRVEINAGNRFESGTVVSMPDKSDIFLPRSGLESNDGLAEALRDGEYQFRILARIASGTDLQVGIRTMNSADQERFAPWLTSGVLNTVPKLTSGAGNKVTPLNVAPADFTAPSGSVYYIECPANKTLHMGGGTYQNMILSTNCPIQMSGAVILDQAIISTTSTADNSVFANTGGGTSIQIGRLDRNCTPGGEAAIITRGGVQTSAKLSFYGGQILAMKTVNFQTKLEGYGMGIVTAGQILGNTDIDAYGCPNTGMENAITGDYFRLTL